MTRLLGCDFSSSPSKRKPIVVAWGEFAGDRVSLKSLEQYPTLSAFSDCLQINREWVGGFDLPFGLPRELVLSLGWPTAWHACMQHYAQQMNRSWKPLLLHNHKVLALRLRFVTG